MLFTIISLIPIQCSREYKKFLNKSISIHFNSSFMQIKQQTSGHNIPLLGVCKQAHTYTHTCAMQSRVGGGLTQAHPNNGNRHPPASTSVKLPDEKLICNK